MKKTNPERQKKAAKRQRSKHAAYMASDTRKDVEFRSEGRCEVALRIAGGPSDVREPTYSPGSWVWTVVHSEKETWIRCKAKATDHHHKTYARYGGDELPEDMVHACERCHDWLESKKPAGNRRSRRSE